MAGLVAIVGASGCRGSAGVGETESPVAEAASAIAAACPGTQQIGRVQQGDSCPAPAVVCSPNAPANCWSHQRLFAGLTPSLPSSLSAFCAYTWTGPGPVNQGALPSYQGGPPNSWLDSDCMAVAAMTTAAGAAVGAVTPELEQAFLAQIEAPTSVPAAPNGGSVRIAVVDAWPDVGKIGNFDHGFGMAAIARKVACTGQSPTSCSAFASPHLALDLVGPDLRSPVNGGFFGYQSRLARMIAEAVFSHAATTPDAKLVVNLSVGWDARYNAGLRGPVSEPVLAVQAAIEHAVCQGALVFAAAGNAGSGPTPGAGPVFPAAWEETLAPTCAGPAPRPLVVAVGGVNGRDLPLANARPGARPTLAAPAFVVPGVMNHGTGSVIGGPFTGSSVATAVASGIASAVWHQNPSLSPDDVVTLMRANGVVSPEIADFCLSSPCGHVRRLSLCRSLEAATGTALPCTKIPIGTGLDPTCSAADVAAIEATVTETFDATDLLTLDAPPICASEIYIPSGLASFPGDFPCPSEMLPNSITIPTVGPQPTPDPCPACNFYPFGEIPWLLLAINEKVSMAFPQVLSLSDRYGVVVARYDLESGLSTSTGDLLSKGIAGGEVVKVELPRLDASLSFDYATIEWVNGLSAQTTSALMIVR